MKRIMFILMLVSLVLLASCNMSFDSKGRAYIVCVGVEYGYDHGPSKLDGCIDDALEMGVCLTKQISNTGVDTQAKYLLCRGLDPDESSMDYPSPSHVISAIRSISVSKDDMIVFFYSGHGDVVENRPAMALPPEQEGGYVSYLDMQTLYNEIEAKGCHGVVIMDCCYSGATAIDESPVTFADGLKSFAQDTFQPSVAVIAACRADEQSSVSTVTLDEPPAYPKQKHGYLTIGILKNLGWTHASASSATVQSGSDSYKVYGRVSEYLQKKSLSKLVSELKGYWAANYTMTVNDTRGDMFLIP